MQHLAAFAGIFAIGGRQRREILFGTIGRAHERHALLLRAARLHQQERETQHAGGQRRQQNAQLRRGNQHRVGKRQVRHENGHGEANAAQNRRAQQMQPVHVLWQVRQLQLHHQKAHGHDAKRLAHQQAEEDAEEHRRAEQRAHIHAREAHVGVRQREQRQNAEIHPRIQLVLKPRCRRDNLACHVRQMLDRLHVLALRQHRLVGIVRAAGLAHLRVGPRGETAQVHARPRRNSERQ